MKKRGIITIVVIFGGLFIGLMVFSAVMISAFGPDGFGRSQNKIGIIEVTGPIMESKKTLEDIRRFSKDDGILGVVVRIDSPGGAVAPSQEIYEAVRKLEEKKPLAVSMGTTAASGGYYIACGSKMIFANAGTITGSIGVITQFFNVEGILETLDVRVNTVKTGLYKDSGSPFKEFSYDDETYFNELVGDIYVQFVDDVARCRDMEHDDVRKVADGRVFTGRQAKELKLVDEVGTFHDAVDYVAQKAGIKGDPSIVYPPKESIGFVGELMRAGVKSTVTEVQQQGAPRLQYLYLGPQ